MGAALPDPPFEFTGKDGPEGFDVGLMQRIAAKLNRDWQLVPYKGADFNGIFAGLNDGSYDCVASGATITPARRTIADFAGNRQYITLGHLKENDRAHIFILHFATQQRVKLWGRARVVEGDLELMERLVDPTYKAKPQRAIVFTLEAWDANCRQHIVPRYSEDELAPAVNKLIARIKELEEEVARLKGDKS